MCVLSHYQEAPFVPGYKINKSQLIALKNNPSLKYRGILQTTPTEYADET